MNRVAAAAAIACAGCGNYSTEDLLFLSALPRREDLASRVPAGGTAAAATSCPIGTADAWLKAKPESDAWNARIGAVVGLIDVVRRHPPTWRGDDQRRWGPFPDKDHPGIEIQVVMARDYPGALGGEPRYSYAFQARRPGAVDQFLNLIAGTFEGPSSSWGRGRVGLDFDAFRMLGMADASTPYGTALIEYDRSGAPARIFFRLQPDLATPIFEYAFRGWGDGSGRFGYRFTDSANGNVFTVGASYASTGAGADVISVTTTSGFTGSVRQCWEVDGCLSYLDDPNNLLNACPGAPCTLGSAVSCPAVPGILREAPDAPWDPVVLAP